MTSDLAMQRDPIAEARVASLLDAATALFLEVGYGAFSLDQLRSAQGESRRTAYTRFGGKEGLFGACVARLAGTITARFDSVDVGDGDLSAQLRQFGRIFADAALDPAALALHRVMVAEGEFFPNVAQAIYQSGRGRAVETVTPLLEAHRDDMCPSLAGMPPHALAEMFLALVINEAQLQALIDCDRLPLITRAATARVDLAVTLFVNGIFGKDVEYG